MNEIILKIKTYLWAVTFPVAVITMLSISSLEDIESGYERFKFGRDITLYLRRSTDQLTYLGAAYTTTSDKKFLVQFNEHLKEREKYFNELGTGKCSGFSPQLVHFGKDALITSPS